MNRKNRPLWRVSVVCPVDLEDILFDLLASELGSAPSAYTSAATGQTVISVFVDDRPGADKLRQIQEAIKILLGGAQPPALEARKIPREEWAESWKKHFQPIRIGNKLLVKASWHKVRLSAGAKTVLLDPGLSFGTGQHPTTHFCLSQIAKFQSRAPAASFLDIGTGSGILAIAAAKLGYQPVEAFDFDPDCVRIARENAALNKVEQSTRFRQANLRELPVKATRRFDLVCANLTDDLLVGERERIVNRLKPDGWLVLAGILTVQFPAVRQAYEALGFKLRESKVKNEWQSGVFVRH